MFAYDLFRTDIFSRDKSLKHGAILRNILSAHSRVCALIGFLGSLGSSPICSPVNFATALPAPIRLQAGDT